MKSRLILGLAILTIGWFVTSAWAEDVPANHAAAQTQSGHVESAADSEHGKSAHEEGIGPLVIEVLSHHFVDSDEFEIFGLEFHLPTFQLGPLRLMTKHQVWWVIAILIVFFFVKLAGRQRTIVPSGLRNALEVLIVFIRDEILRPNLHSKADMFLPYFLSLFTCIFVSNLLGLMPWGTTSTGNLNMTAGLSICSLLLIIGIGVKENGVWGFLAEFSPPGVPLWLMPLMVVVEISSFFIRPFALTIRLFANMLAGHAVIAVVLALIVAPIFSIPSVAVAVGVTLLEVLVALIQAYIFVILTAVFMSLAMHPAH